MNATATAPAPEHNVSGIDYQERGHLRYAGPITDVHAHVLRTRLPVPEAETPPGPEPAYTLEQAETMLAVGREFGVGRTFSMCYPDDIGPLRERFGKALEFIGSITKKPEESEDVAYQLLDRFLGLGVRALKFWSAPRGRERGLFVDAPWRIEAARRARTAGVRVVMVHVADPDRWFQTTYADAAKFGSKPEQYVGLERMIQMFPDMTWIGAHMGGDPEHPDHLEELLERYPNLYFDTSATKWQVREVSPRREAVRSLVCRHPERFLFGTDSVTRHGLPREHYVSRYWCQRTLWESVWEGPSPIADPDFAPPDGQPSAPMLQGVGLPPEVVRQVYHDNLTRLFPES
jgi:predicted TIM-barrel fold metal-dependent hydrolase